MHFAIIAEGPSDQRVIENIIQGVASKSDNAATVIDIQPTPNSGGGWTEVIHALQCGMAGEALGYCDFVVVHVDTDVCEEKGFDVLRRVDGRELTTEELISAVEQRLRDAIGETFTAIESRVIFAIAVNSIECWLLPVLFDHEPAKAAKTTGCLKTANDVLYAQNKAPLKSGDSVNVPAYREVSRAYSKRKILRERSPRNSSLEQFVMKLQAAISAQALSK